ncbi:MAG: ABC transporter ATP-binding protein [Eubacterium sp.]
MALLSVHNAAFNYEKSNRLIFDDLNFTVSKGEIFCIIGPNGCGKTTLIDTILGVHKLKQGQMLLHELPLRSYSPRAFAKHIAYVPQSHQTTFPYNVIDVVVMGCTHQIGLLSAPNTAQFEKGREALNTVGLSGFEHRPYTELSGGELQLVLIARALAQSAELLLMDEPTAHLDFRHELSVMEIITTLVKEKRISVIMATHFLNQAFYFENAQVPIRVALMDDGRFTKVGSPSGVLTEENLKHVFHIITTVTQEQGRKFIIALKNERNTL